MSGVDNLVAFLRARLDEDAAVVREANTSPEMVTGIPRSYAQAPVALHIGRFADPERVLAEIDAKRLLLDDHPIMPETYPRPTVGGKEVGGPYYPFGCENCHAEHDTGEVHGFGYCLVWQALALPYADHDDYRPEWRP
jgi:Family of unknown function (DUF6221)